MLSAESEGSASVVRATLPAVTEALDEIASRFYGTMFHDRPELLDHPDTGDAVTPEAGAARDEVYWLMAGALITMEARLHHEAGLRPGHVWRRWTVVERRTETPDTVSFVIRPADGQPAPRARAGRYVSVRVPMPDGVRQLRRYSLSSEPGGDLRRITVKRITVKRVAGADGAPDDEVSDLLFGDVCRGDELTLSTPSGDIVLDDAEDASPVVLVSAGIGLQGGRVRPVVRLRAARWRPRRPDPRARRTAPAPKAVHDQHPRHPVYRRYSAPEPAPRARSTTGSRSGDDQDLLQ
ncbi:hypothetical protein [Streptomyces coelicoflavus]|uniref:hypothetical protein n=1 Tax=Streptomyces coelicoflavus TaxID=285562 RepID=UPI002E254E5B